MALTDTVFGSGRYTYRADAAWGRGPQGVPAFGLVSTVACDSQDRVYVFQRLPDPQMLVFDRDGRLLSRWGEGAFRHPHGVWIGPDDALYCTDRETHTVTQWTLDGRLLRTWGTPGQPGAPGQPFNEPTKVYVTSGGDMYVSDGYGQHRVHHFGPDGALHCSWGEQGTGPGQFGWPVHSVWVDPRGRVLVLDRQNGRIQRFGAHGEYQGEWGGYMTPMDVYVDADQTLYLAEGGGRMTILNLDGGVLSQWGERGDGAGQFAAAPHCCWVDSRGDLYVSEVTTHDRLQKFVRQ
jgi:hypothetical protein